MSETDTAQLGLGGGRAEGAHRGGASSEPLPSAARASAATQVQPGW